MKINRKKNPESEVSHTIVRVENKEKSFKGNLDVQSRQNPQWKTDPSNCKSPGSKTHAKSPEEGKKSSDQKQLRPGIEG